MRITFYLVSKKMYRCRTRKDNITCIKRITGILLLIVVLFLLTMIFLKTSTYAIYSRMCNMTSGCLFIEPNCTDAFILYTRSDLVWAFILVLIELSLGCISAILWIIIKNSFEYPYDKHTLVSELPSVPTDSLY